MTYGEPINQYNYRMIGTLSINSPRQAMLMESVMVEAMARYAGKPEESLLAKWHNTASNLRRKAASQGWRGWEDDHPIEPKTRAADGETKP